MFYRQGGSASRINAQYDAVYVDFVGGATAWLPISKGNVIAVNIARASILFGTSAQSTVTKSPVAPEAQILMEYKMFGGDADEEAWPIDQWQNMVVATDRRAHGNGWVRLRAASINNADGTGVAMALQVSRSGDPGAST
jgi:hypothetical protein